MLRNDQIQSALIAYAKSKSVITDELIGSVEIRENQWQGTQFVYPNIRLMMRPTTVLDRGCSKYNISFSWLVFSEEASSLEVDRISGIISNELNDKSFTYQSIGFMLWTTSLIPAIRQDRRKWRSEVLMNGIASA